MGKSERDKGARVERQIRDLLPGSQKISRAYANGADLMWLDRLVEVKARGDGQGFKFLYTNLRDVSFLVMKADRRPPLIAMELDTLLDLMDEAFTDGWGSDGP